MIRVVRAEWRKLRRPTLFFGTLSSVGAVSILAASIMFIAMDQPRRGRERSFTAESIQSAHGLATGFANVAGLLGIVAIAIFAAQTAQEYSNGTLRNLLVRQPKRATLLAGKAFAMALFALMVVTFSLIISVATSFVWAGSKNLSTAAWTVGGLSGEGISNLLNAYGNVIMATIFFGIFGMILGLLLRSPISSIAIGIAWVLIVESIIGAVWESTQKYLPGVLFSAVGTGGTMTLDYGRALLTALTLLVIAGGVATLLFKRRDVSS